MGLLGQSAAAKLALDAVFPNSGPTGVLNVYTDTHSLSLCICSLEHVLDPPHCLDSARNFNSDVTTHKLLQLFRGYGEKLSSSHTLPGNGPQTIS